MIGAMICWVLDDLRYFRLHVFMLTHPSLRALAALLGYVSLGAVHMDTIPCHVEHKSIFQCVCRRVYIKPRLECLVN